MLLTLSTTHRPATDLGYLLHKHPERCHQFDLSFGRAHVFYPEASTDRCTAALLLEVDPVGLVRGKGDWARGMLDQYVNDRPYVASSLLSVAIARVFGSALAGRSQDRPDLACMPIPLTARIETLPIRGDAGLLERLFAPLGYTIAVTRHSLDERFAAWGESPYYQVALSQSTTLADLLSQLYVLIPVFDHRKHYYVGQDEVDKLLAKGAGWLAEHPERDLITRRYLVRKPNLARQALARLVEEEQPDVDGDDDVASVEPRERDPSLHEQRLGAVMAVLRASNARRVLDLGCGEGRLTKDLMAVPQFEEILAVDASTRSLEIAARRLRLDRLPERQGRRVRLLHGALTYRDKRLEGYDAAAIVEVIEHLDPPRLAAFERVVFEFARPSTVVLTTPNREYNVVWETLPAGSLRHGDHRFEWTRAEFNAWAGKVADRFGYRVRFMPVGPESPAVGAPSQMAIFEHG